MAGVKPLFRRGIAYTKWQGGAVFVKKTASRWRGLRQLRARNSLAVDSVEIPLHSGFPMFAGCLATMRGYLSLNRFLAQNSFAFWMGKQVPLRYWMTLSIFVFEDRVMDTISRSAALQIAQAKVHELASIAGDDFALQPNHTREIEQGWVFFFNSADYVRTGNYIHALAGNGPLLVLRNGNVIMLPSAVPWEGVVSEMARPTGGRAA